MQVSSGPATVSLVRSERRSSRPFGARYWRRTGGAALKRSVQGGTSATIIGAQPNKRLKLPARVDYGMNLSSARRSLSAAR